MDFLSPLTISLQADSAVKTGVLPFWARVVLRASTNQAGRVATAAINIFGLLSGLLYLILRSNSINMAFRPNAASWEQKQEWRLFGSPDIDIGKHITNPVGPERSGTFYEAVLAGKEKGGFESTSSRAPSDPARPRREHSELTSLPSYRTPSKSTISKPPLSSPPSYRAPPILDAHDPLLVSPPTFQIPPQVLRSETSSLSFNHAAYSLFPQRSSSIPVIRIDHVDSAKTKSVIPPAPLFSTHHKRDASNVTSATVHIGMRISTVVVKAEAEVGINRAATYPPTMKSAKDWSDPSHMTQRSLDQPPKTSDALFGIKGHSRESSPHEILFRLNSNEELSPKAVHFTPSFRHKPFEDLVSPTRRISSWRKFRDRRMKSLPPVPATPSTFQPLSGHRASFPEPRTPVSPEGPVRISQERAALSVALKEDEQWPIHGIDMVLLPDKSYSQDRNRSWI
jgi:hypothetical protein